MFSELFTGTTIHSATSDHWEDVTGGAGYSKPTGAKGGKDASIADFDANKPTKSTREHLFMRYSPLVERYLITHNYETINNVKKWKCVLTQRTDIQKNCDAKFKKFKEISNQSVQTKNNLIKEYKSQCKKADEQHSKNKEDSTVQMKYFNASMKDKLRNDKYPEYANIMTAI